MYRRTPPALALLAAFASAGLSLNAQTSQTWVGNSSSADLLDGANWSTNTTPITGNNWIFGAGGSAGTSLTLGANLNIGRNIGPPQLPALDFSAGAAAYTFGGTGQLTIATGGLRNNSGQIQTFNNPIRLNTGSGHSLGGANSAWDFNGVITVSGNNNFNLGGAVGQSITFDGNLTDATARPLNLTGGGNASTVSINGSTNTGLGTLSIGQNVRVNVGSASGLSNATSVLMNAAGATLANTSGSALTTNASLAFNNASQNYTFGDATHTAANNLTFNGTTVISADQTRTLTLNGTGLTVASASVWNNSFAGSRTLTVNGAGNTLALRGLGIGASDDNTDVTLTLTGSANITLSGGVTNGQGTGTRSLQVNSSGIVSFNGLTINNISFNSDYSGTTGIGGNATLLVNGTHTGGGSYTIQGTLGGIGTINLSDQNAVIQFASTGANRRLSVSSADGLTIIGGTSAALNLTNAAGRTDGFQSFFFDLGAPGTTVVDVQGLLNLGSGTLNFDDFAFTTSAGFGAGVYRLFDYTSFVGSLGTNLTGTIGGLGAAISNDSVNSAVIVTVIPEPSTYAAFAGLGALGLAAFRRRRRA